MCNFKSGDVIYNKYGRWKVEKVIDKVESDGVDIIADCLYHKSGRGIGTRDRLASKYFQLYREQRQFETTRSGKILLEW